MVMSSDERRRLADLARQLEREAPELSLVLTDSRPAVTTKLMRRARRLTGFEAHKARRTRQILAALLLVGIGLPLTVAGLVRQLPLLFGPGLVLASIVPVLWLAELAARIRFAVLRYYRDPNHRPPQ